MGVEVPAAEGIGQDLNPAWGTPAWAGLPQGCYVTQPWVSFAWAFSISDTQACALAPAAK